jgi:hypothetical protein
MKFKISDERSFQKCHLRTRSLQGGDEHENGKGSETNRDLEGSRKKFFRSKKSSIPDSLPWTSIERLCENFWMQAIAALPTMF